MKWTPEQLQAINEMGSNIIVSAGAGSGKTAVLSERVIKHLKEGFDIREILMLTFTNEAAGEMANRIRKKIKKENLKEQLEYLDSAYITTFDAYALSLVKKYHYILNISKDISIIDSSVINLERKRQLDIIFENLYECRDPLFLKLIDNFTSRDDTSIKEAVLSINSLLDLKYNKDEYLDSYITNFYSDDYINKIFNEYFLYVKNLCKSLEDDLYLLENYMEEDAYLKIYNSVKYLFNPKKYDDLVKYNDLKIDSFRKLDEEGKELKDQIKKTFSEIQKLIYYDEETLKKQYKDTLEYAKIFIKIIRMLDEKINEYKNKNSRYEFTDIAKMAIKIVKENKEIREEIKHSFKEIMIDEYQDTSDLQEEFIREIENNNVYMVGDIKQSIYRFRNANPLIFKDKYDNYANNNGGIKIDLISNFRSREEVLININEIFELIMASSLGGVNYKNNHAMVYGNKAYITNGKNDNNNYMDLYTYSLDTKEYKNDEIEAFTIASQIKKMYSDKYQVYDFDLEKNRDITYNDFCIILDRGSSFSLYKKVFEYFHIPMDIYKDSNLMDEYDLYIIKNIIGLIIKIYEKKFDKETKYYFTSVARSYLGNMSDNAIYEALEENKIFQSEIYNICFDLSENLDEKTPNSLLKEIIKEFNVYEKLILVGNVDAGIKRINYLIKLTSDVEDLGFTIWDFKDYLEQMINDKEEIKYKEAKSNSSSVKLMNIHKSKGLEFPICFFTGFAKTFNLRDLQSRFMFDKNYGFILPFYNDGIGETFVKTLVKSKYYEEEIAEKIRLFYVALTRAKEKMIMVMPDIKNKHKVNNQISYNEGIKYRSFYDFISSVAINLSKYFKTVNLNDINLSHDYEIVNSVNTNICKEDIKMSFIENSILKETLNNNHASKTINKIITLEDKKKMEFGSHIHELLELTNFYEESDNKYIQNLMNTFDFKNAKIYQELEFIYESDNIYHGVIDLVLEYSNEIKIIDYKLKDITDKEYEKQLKVYYEYFKTLTNKKITLYLYSIIDNLVKIVEV